MKKVIISIIVVLTIVLGTIITNAAVIEIAENKEIKNIISSNNVIEIVTQDNKEESNYLIRDEEKCVIMFSDESYLIVNKNNSYKFIPLIKEDIEYNSTDLKEIGNIITEFYNQSSI